MGEIHLSLMAHFHNAFCSGQDRANISVMLKLATFRSVSVILTPLFCCLCLSAVQLLLLGTSVSSLLLDHAGTTGMFLSLSVLIAYLLFSSTLMFSFPLLYFQIFSDNHSSTVVLLPTHFPLPVNYSHVQTFICFQSFLCFPFSPTLNN